MLNWMLENLLLTSGGATAVIFVLARIIPNQKLYECFWNIGVFVTSKGSGTKVGGLGRFLLTMGRGIPGQTPDERLSRSERSVPSGTRCRTSDGPQDKVWFAPVNSAFMLCRRCDKACRDLEGSRFAARCDVRASFYGRLI